MTAGPPGVTEWQRATEVGADRVVELPDHVTQLVETMALRPQGAGNGLVVTVVGGSGGAGASVFAAALALRGRDIGLRPRTLLVDGDNHGGGLDHVLRSDKGGLFWSDLMVRGGRIPSTALHAALPQVGPGLSVLSWGRDLQRERVVHSPSVSAIESVLNAGREGGDLVICDASRAGDPGDEAMVAWADLTVLVVRAELRAVVATTTVIPFVAVHNSNIGVVVRGPAPGGLRAVDIANELEIPLLAAMRAQPGVAERIERDGLRLGRRGPLRAAASAVLTVLGNQPTTEWRAA